MGAGGKKGSVGKVLASKIGGDLSVRPRTHVKESSTCVGQSPSEKMIWFGLCSSEYGVTNTKAHNGGTMHRVRDFGVLGF